MGGMNAWVQGVDATMSGGQVWAGSRRHSVYSEDAEAATRSHTDKVRRKHWVRESRQRS